MILNLLFLSKKSLVSCDIIILYIDKLRYIQDYLISMNRVAYYVHCNRKIRNERYFFFCFYHTKI